jgi:hypothetical protein
MSNNLPSEGNQCIKIASPWLMLLLKCAALQQTNTQIDKLATPFRSGNTWKNVLKLI